MSFYNVTVSITLSHYHTRDPTRREQGPINSRGVTVFTTDHFIIIIIIVSFTTLAHIRGVGAKFEVVRQILRLLASFIIRKLEQM